MSNVESSQHALMAAAYRAAGREVVIPQRPRTTKSVLHNLATEQGFFQYVDAVRSAPDRFPNLAPWSDAAMEDNTALFKEAKERGVIKDTFREQLTERAKTLRPHKYFNKKPEILERYLNAFDQPQHRIIAELPGKEGEGLFTAILAERQFNEQLYSRNRPIMSKEKQKWFHTLKTVHAGMGVGGSGAKGLVKAGVLDLRVADPGVLNLKDDNRLTDADVATLLDNHAEDWTINATLRNPHIKVLTINQRIGDGSEDTYDRAEFMRDADFVFEEVDDIREKVRMRQEAQRQGITVIMATDVGYGTVIEVQRPEDPIFPDLTEKDWKILDSERELTFEEASDMATKIIGAEYIKGDYFRKAPEEGRSYWAQTGASADASSAAIVKTLSDLYDESQGGPRVPAKKAYLLDELQEKSRLIQRAVTLYERGKRKIKDLTTKRQNQTAA